MRLLILMAAVGLGAAWAQSNEFDVASIKPSKSDPSSSGFDIDRGLVRMNNVTVESLLTNAFQILPNQISGLPSWAESERYDIQAKAEEDPTLSTRESMSRTNTRLQALLMSRFQLTFHRETKEVQGYSLVVDKKGPKLKSSKEQTGSSHSHMGNGHFEATGVTMEGFARQIAGWLKGPTTNETGLAGQFDITLDFESETDPIVSREPSKPSIFTALRDQLGLKLEPRKLMVEMLVIDRVERPSEN